MDEEKILNKILAISDVENLSQYKNLSKEEISKKILSGSDLYDRQTKLSDQEQYKLPEVVIKPLRKYLPNCVWVSYKPIASHAPLGQGQRSLLQRR